MEIEFEEYTHGFMLIHSDLQAPYCTPRFDSKNIYGWTGPERTFGDCGSILALPYFIAFKLVSCILHVVAHWCLSLVKLQIGAMCMCAFVCVCVIHAWCVCVCVCVCVFVCDAYVVTASINHSQRIRERDANVTFHSRT